MGNLHDHDFLQRAENARRQIREIDPEDLKVLLADGAILIDVRDDEEFEAGHIAGARHLKGSTLTQQAPQALPDRTRPIAVVCAGGNRSAIAALDLQELGYESVVSLRGGLRLWPDPLVRPVATGR